MFPALGAPWGNWQPEGFWFPKFWFESRRGSMEGNLAAIVLAAGQGKRLKSKRPKVLHEIAGRSLVAHVVTALCRAGVDRIVVVGPADLGALRAALASVPDLDRVDLVVQDPPLGTGDAVKKGMTALGTGVGTVLVANGDTPL